MKNPFAIIILFVLLIFVAWFYYEHYKLLQAPQVPSSTPAIGTRIKDSNCTAQGSLPDKQCTPGAVFEQATVADICVSGYTKTVRNVPGSLKHKVYAEYGVTHHSPGEYEVDHLIALELGGSNDIANLWPEPAEPQPGFHQKDEVENYLHQEVCSGRMDLRKAQALIANDWLDVYKQMN